MRLTGLEDKSYDQKNNVLDIKKGHTVFLVGQIIIITYSTEVQSLADLNPLLIAIQTFKFIDITQAIEQ